MKLRMINQIEIEIIKNGARIADIGGEEIVRNIKEGASELEIAISGRGKWKEKLQKLILMQNIWILGYGFSLELTLMVHMTKNNRKLKGDIALNTFPMISGYYTALERTLFLDSADDDS